MAFGIGINTQQTNAGEMRGARREIACECWFTKSGNTIPIMIKFEDENGEIQTVREIAVLHSERKNYAGISTMEHACRIGIGGKQYNVRLVFVQSECKWMMLV